jgi:hypothetical protein
VQEMIHRYGTDNGSMWELCQSRIMKSRNFNIGALDVQQLLREAKERIQEKAMLDEDYPFGGIGRKKWSTFAYAASCHLSPPNHPLKPPPRIL